MMRCPEKCEKKMENGKTDQARMVKIEREKRTEQEKEERF